MASGLDELVMKLRNELLTMCKSIDVDSMAGGCGQ